MLFQGTENDFAQGVVRKNGASAVEAMDLDELKGFVAEQHSANEELKSKKKLTAIMGSDLDGKMQKVVIALHQDASCTGTSVLNRTKRPSPLLARSTTSWFAWLPARRRFLTTRRQGVEGLQGFQEEGLEGRYRCHRRG